MRTKYSVNIRPNKNNESTKSTHAQPEATYGRAAKEKKRMYRKLNLQQHENH